MGIKLLYFSLFQNELRRELIIWWSYRVNAIGSLVMWGVIFPVLLVTLISVAEVSGVEYGESLQTASLIGFLVWKLCMGVLSSLPSMIEDEAGAGTLENLVLSAQVPFGALFGARVVVRSGRSLLETLLLGVTVSFLLQLPLSISPLALFVALLTLLGIWGVGFALAGLALIYKSISSVTELVGYLAFSISGAFVPINGLGWLFVVLKYTFPMTWGIDLLRQVMIENAALEELLNSGSLLGLLLQTAVLLIVGVWSFQAALKQVMIRGELSLS